MNIKQRLYPLISHGAKAVAFVLLMLVTACGAQEDPDVEKEDKLQLSDQEITLGVDGWNSMTSSRATIFESSDDIVKESNNKGGGNFKLFAYLRETNATFIGGSRVWYFVPKGATIGTWEFYDETNNTFPQYFWPQNNSVDFFAYMPWVKNGGPTNISMGDYDSATGQSISCQMQAETTLVDTDGQETLIAYAKNKSKSDKSVDMHFVHPFSAISFELSQAHRNLTINWIRFNNIYLKGTTTLDDATRGNTTIEWTPQDSPGTFKISVEKTIPDDINFGGEIGGPYLVMPQDLTKGTTDDELDDVTMTIEYKWDNADKDNNDDDIPGDEDPDLKNDIYRITRSITTGSLKEWIAGKKYTYVLYLGNNEAEILFKVKVEDWDEINYDHIIDLE